MDKITNESQYLDRLANISALPQDVNFDILSESDIKAIEEKEQEILDFTEMNSDFDSYDEKQRDKLFETVISKWNELKDLIKNAKCHYTSTGLEIKVLEKKLTQSVEYTAETLFYGLHLKKYFLDELPKTKDKDDFTSVELEITFSQSVALYHVLSSLSVKGLNRENYAFANILYMLSEITKVYNHYDALSSRLNKVIGQWNMGLTVDDAKKLEEEIKKETIKEAIQ